MYRQVTRKAGHTNTPLRSRVFVVGFGISVLLLVLCVLLGLMPGAREAVLFSLEAPYPYTSYPVGLRYSIAAFVVLNFAPSFLVAQVIPIADGVMSLSATVKAVTVVIGNLLLSALWWYVIAASVIRWRSWWRRGA